MKFLKKREEQMIAFEFVTLLISSILIGMKNFNILIYVFFLVYSIISIVKYTKEKNIIHILKIMIYSIIIPNNYIVILVLLIEIGFIILKKREKITITFLSLIVILYICLNILISNIQIPNLMFSLLYWGTLVLSYYVCRTFKDEIKVCFIDIIKFLRKIVLIEFATIVTYFIFHINEVRLSIDFDWVVGTFGKYQGNILLFFMLFAFLMFCYDYKRSKDKKNYIYIILTLLISIYTGSIALLILFLMAYGIILVTGKFTKEKVLKVSLIFVSVLSFIIITPTWIKEYIVKLMDYDYALEHISKIKTYEDTFIEIPKKDKKFLFFGDGIGNYSSRAALTCTGIYINSYSKMFEVSMSNYTKKYIYPALSNVMQNHLGSMDTPYSSVITIQGEFGLIGIVFLIVCFLKGFINNSTETSRTYLLFFLFSCFIENYLEFAKIVLLVHILYFITYNNERGK